MSVVILIILVLILSYLIIEAPVVFGILLGIIILGIVFYIIKNAINKKNKENTLKEFQEKHKSEIDSCKKKYNQYVAELEFLKEQKFGLKARYINIEDDYYVIGGDNSVCFAKIINPQELFINYIENGKAEIIEPKEGKIISEKYDKRNILFWRELGDIRYVSNVSGGGSSIKGAVAGAVVAGEAGAIIGSRKGVTTETKEIDTRELVVKFANGTEKKLTYIYKEALMQTIPEKEYSFVMAMNRL